MTWTRDSADGGPGRRGRGQAADATRRATRVLLVILVAVCMALVASGCRGNSPGPSAPVPESATRFSGSTSTGVSVSVDFDAFDPLLIQISRALMGAPRPVALAAVVRVDDGAAGSDPMQLLAITGDGREVPLVEAWILLQRVGTPAARRTLREIRDSHGARRASRLRYQGAVDVRADRIVGVRLTVGTEVIALSPEPR
ncbi:MAG: hypothetical protein H6531_09595 [Actinobacteria bacterium]|nr:hypothetical protein [Actinomycetota bacterium]